MANNGESAGERGKLLSSMASLIADYRKGEIEASTPEHVGAWLGQFDEDEETATGFLRELHHVLSASYLSKKRALGYLSGLVHEKNLVGGDPKAFWKSTNILEIQQRGDSQKELKKEFGKVLKDEFQITSDDCCSPKGPFIYIDEAIFTGTHVLNDIRAWLPTAPANATLHVIAFAVYSAGEFSIKKALPEIFRENKKSLQVTIWRWKTYQNFSNQGPDSDVLRLREYPSDEASRQFLESYGDGKPPALLRPKGQPTTTKLFTGEMGRDLLERVFWKAGLQIRESCPYLKVMHRPLGYTTTNSANKLGFGSLFVSYRNCPNNCPLALWAGDPWYPLFPRKTNK